MRVIDRPDLRVLSPIGECERLEGENAMLRDAIAAFVKASEWGADAWKAQPHIRRLFDIANAEAHGRAVARTVQPLVGGSNQEERP